MHVFGIFRVYLWTWTILSVEPKPRSAPHPPTTWRNRVERHSATSRSNEDADSPASIGYRLDFWSQYDNPEEGMAHEGDIFEVSSSRKATTRLENLLWPHGLVRYFVDRSILNEPTKFAILEDAMRDITERSCIKFQRIFPDDKGAFPSHSWVNITGNQKGCFSDLGRSTFEPSNLNLNVDRCFRLRGHALHEILHTLGIYHEHMRPDRDEFIDIHWDNVKEGEMAIFSIDEVHLQFHAALPSVYVFGEDFNFHLLDDRTITTYGLPYDYDSIMHYSMTAFSKNKSVPTIVPLEQDVEIGQRDHLSVYDVHKLLITYKCNDIVDDSLYRRMNQPDHGKHVDSYLTETSTTANSLDSPSNSYNSIYEADNEDLIVYSYRRQRFMINTHDESSQKNNSDAMLVF